VNVNLKGLRDARRQGYQQLLISAHGDVVPLLVLPIDDKGVIGQGGEHGLDLPPQVEEAGCCTCVYGKPPYLHLLPISLQICLEGH